MNPRTAERLRIWIDGLHVAYLLRDPRAHQKPYGIQYSDEITDQNPSGGLCLSASLPVTRRLILSKKGPGPVDNWLSNLLPEGPALETMEDSAQLARGDTFEFLRHYGHDCAGAVSFLEPDLAPDTTVRPEGAPVNLAEAIEQLDSFPLTGHDGEEGLSLGGFQSKLLITQRSDGSFTWPQLNVPSTHICKPDPQDQRTEGLVVSEAIAMEALRLAGVRTANTSIGDVSGRAVLMVTRFDRLLGPDGQHGRLHQENLCQSVGLHPRNKYQRRNGPSYKQLADVLVSHAADPELELIELLRQVAATVSVGNTDAHGCNYGFLIKDGEVTLAPAYDVANTTAFLSPRGTKGHRLALHPDGKDHLSYVSRRSLVDEATRWGLTSANAVSTINDVVERLRDAVPQAIENNNRWIGPRVQPSVEAMISLGTRLRESSLD